MANPDSPGRHLQGPAPWPGLLSGLAAALALLVAAHLAGGAGGPDAGWAAVALGQGAAALAAHWGER